MYEPNGGGSAKRSNALGHGRVWMPFTANRQFKAAPRLLVEAHGMYYTAQDGHRCSMARPACGA